MRTGSQLEAEIKKLRIVINLDVTEKVRDQAWCMMLALQWAKTSPTDMKLSALDLCGINIKQADAVRKMAKRNS